MRSAANIKSIVAKMRLKLHGHTDASARFFMFAKETNNGKVSMRFKNQERHRVWSDAFYPFTPELPAAEEGLDWTLIEDFVTIPLSQGDAKDIFKGEIIYENVFFYEFFFSICIY